MQDVYPAADLAVSRAGASSLGEISAFSLPSVLIPYPHAAEDHQRLNADIFVSAGAGRLLEEKGATGDGLAQLLRSLLESPGTRAEMAAAAGRLAPREAAGRVAAVLEEVAA
jgi:UDP-N-acetylglucosamine--N-acetylmuramyl-(pentapeptide) pyrophosphoryl-undecaprenol N-acetylglucosamine transferase